MKNKISIFIILAMLVSVFSFFTPVLAEENINYLVFTDEYVNDNTRNNDM